MEEWRDIKGYDGLYQISSQGRVKSFIFWRGLHERILTPFGDTHGYSIVSLWKNKEKTKLKIHRLVLQAFVPNPENKPQGNHKNGIRNDNRLENLEWADNSENNLHAYRILGRKKAMIGRLGANSPRSKPVNQFSTDGIFVATHISQCEAAKQIGQSWSSISQACRGRIKTAGGYIWKFAEQKTL